MATIVVWCASDNCEMIESEEILAYFCNECAGWVSKQLVEARLKGIDTNFQGNLQINFFPYEVYSFLPADIEEPWSYKERAKVEFELDSGLA